MNRCFVDTNLFIRYFPLLADRVEQLLDDAEAGYVRLVTTELVMAESVWVLECLTHAHIAQLIRSILATPGMDVINGDLVGKALVMYELQNIDFVDAYIAALMEKQGIKDIYSFDRKHLSRKLKPSIVKSLDTVVISKRPSVIFSKNHPTWETRLGDTWGLHHAGLHKPVCIIPPYKRVLTRSVLCRPGHTELDTCLLFYVHHHHISA